MAFPTTVDSLVDAVTVVHASQVLGPQRVTVGPTWFNVKSDQYGAVGNGTTDDTAAINSALQAAISAGSGMIYFPPGTYLISVSVKTGGQTWATGLMYGGNTFIQGAGRNATIIKLVNNAQGTVGTTSNTASMITPWATGQEQITFQDLTIDGNAANQTDQISGIYVLQQRGVKFHRVRIQNCRGTSNSGGSTETFLYYLSGSTDVGLVDCDAIQTAGTCSNGFAANGCTSVSHLGCRAIGIGTAGSLGFGFNVGTGGTADSRQIYYGGCHAYLCGGQGYHLDSAVQNIIYEGCVAGGVASDASAQYPFTANQNLGNQLGWVCVPAVSDVLWSNCIAYGNTSTGFEIRAGTGLTFNACVSTNNGGAGINFNTGAPVANLIGGDYSGNTAFGIGCQTTAIAGNIRITGGPTMTGNGSGPLQVAGTNYTPGGNVAAPSVPGTGTALTNPFPYDADIYLLPGTSTVAVSIAGQSTGMTLAASGVAQLIRLPAKESITLTYANTPTWKWFIA